MAVENLKELLTCELQAQCKYLNDRIDHNFEMDKCRHQQTKDWFAEVDAHRIEVKLDWQKYLDENLKARKELFEVERTANEEAVHKVEQSTMRQFESFQRQISDLKERMDRGTGRHEEHTEGRMSNQWIIGLIIAILLALMSNIVMIFHMYYKP